MNPGILGPDPGTQVIAIDRRQRRIRSNRQARIARGIDTVTHPDHGPVTVLDAQADNAGVLVTYETQDRRTSTRDLASWPELQTAIDRWEVDRQKLLDHAALHRGLVLCWCSRWIHPDQLDDLGTCGSDRCRRCEAAT